MRATDGDRWSVLVFVSAILLKGGDFAWASDGAGFLENDAEEYRRLEDQFNRRLTVEPTHPRWLQERGMLPALQVGSLKLRQVVTVHKDDPFTIRHIEIPEDHGLKRKGRSERLLQALEEVVSTPFLWQTPRDTIRVLAALNAVAQTDGMYNGSKSYWSDEWGMRLFSENNHWIYKKPDCTNMSLNMSNTPPPQDWEDRSQMWWCPNTTTSTTTTSGRRLEKPKKDLRQKYSEKPQPVRRKLSSKEKELKPTLPPPDWADEDKNPINETLAKENFEREMKYLMSARFRFRARIDNISAASMSSTFEGQRRQPCDPETTPADAEQCENDVGVALSVYEDDKVKVLVYHGHWKLDSEYVRWAHKNSIIDKFQDQILLQWAINARQTIDDEMYDRMGYQIERMTTTCKFREATYGPFGEDPAKNNFYKDMKISAADDKNGLWFLVKRLTRIILPEGRNKILEAAKDVLLTGSGLGGASAAMVTMWLNKVEADTYPTYAIAPTGFNCFARRFPTDMSPWNDFPFLKVYTHVFDTIGELGKLSGEVCLFGLKNFSAGSPAQTYCKGMVGFNGPQLMYEDDDEVMPLSTEDETIWTNYRGWVDSGKIAFRACQYYTHSAWYAAALMADTDILFLDGRTDGGCHDTPGVPKDDALVACPTEAELAKDCDVVIVGKAPLPVGMMMTVMTTLASFIVGTFLIMYICLESVKGDDWVYGKEGRFDLERIFPCLFRKDGPQKKKAFDGDRAQDARIRAKAIRHQKYVKVQEKHDIYDKANFGLGKTQTRLENKVKEKKLKKKREYEALLKQNLCGRDVWVQIKCARDLRNADFIGKSDPVCLVQILGKEHSRIITPIVQNTTDPVWNHQEILHGFEAEDEIELSVWDDDPGNINPEEGDLLGRVTIEAERFFPNGMPLQNVYLDDCGDMGSYVQMQIVCLNPSSPEPDFPMTLRESLFHIAEQGKRNSMEGDGMSSPRANRSSKYVDMKKAGTGSNNMTHFKSMKSDEFDDEDIVAKVDEFEEEIEEEEHIEEEVHVTPSEAKKKKKAPPKDAHHGKAKAKGKVGPKASLDVPPKNKGDKMARKSSAASSAGNRKKSVASSAASNRSKSPAMSATPSISME